MFKKSDWDNFLRIIEREKNGFDWDIPGGYIIFGSMVMSIHKLIKGRWMCKTVNNWRNKTYQQVNAELKEMKWS